MRRAIWLIPITAALVLLLTTPTNVMAQGATGRTGTLNGTIADPDGAPLPGVTVTVSGPVLMTPSVMVTGVDGRYRAPALPPGLYTVDAVLEGFGPMQQNDVRVSMGATLAVNFTMEIGGVTETVTVTGEAPLVDVRGSSSNTTTFSDEYLDALPANRSNSGASDFLGMAPGANLGRTRSSGSASGRGGSALGGTNQGTQFSYDGVLVNSAEGGEVEMQMDVDNVAEASFGGVGAPAEVGGYSGMVMNLVTKSGGPRLQGTANYFLRADGWNSQNSDDPQFIQTINNNNQQHIDIGGPLAANTLWGYGSYRRSKSTEATEVSGGTEGFSRRWSVFGKLSWQMSDKDRLQGSIAFERGAGIDPADLFVSPESVQQPFGKWDTYFADYLRIFNPDTVLEVHAGLAANASSDYPGATDINPNTDTAGLLPPAHFDEATGLLSESPGFFFDRTRNRYQLNASISHYADEFLGGSHDFKAGFQSSSDPTRTHTGYTGGAFYVDYAGEPLYKYELPSQNDQPKNRTIAFFAQDAWTLAGDRLTINPGVRITSWQGSAVTDRGAATGIPAVTDDFGTPFKPKTGFAPRIGLTYDLLGDGTTALKGHYGKYYSQIITSMYLAPGESIFQGFFWNGTEYELEFTEFQSPLTPIDPNLRMNYFNEFSVGLERQLSRTVGVELTYINRRTKDFMDYRLGNGIFRNLTGVDDQTPSGTGESYQLWDQTNVDESDFLNTNPERLPILFPFDFNGFSQSRRYDGVGLTLEKRFSDGWSANLSYFYGRTKGTDDTAFENGRGSSLGPSRNWRNPNNHFNADGPLQGDRPHNIKATGSARIGSHIAVGGFFWIQSGMPYQRSLRFRNVDFTGRNRGVFVEPRGSRRTPTQVNLDLRVEGRYPIGRAQLRVMADVFNVFNSGTITRVRTEDDPFNDNPSNAFGATRNLRFPRNIRLGFIVNF